MIRCPGLFTRATSGRDDDDIDDDGVDDDGDDDIDDVISLSYKTPL